MILYKETGEVSSSPPATESNTLSPTTSPEITERLQKLGILLSPEIFDRIQRAGQGENLKQDILAVDVNPGEKNRFEQLYLNGYGQTVDTPFGKLSFAEIQTHEKKDEILDDVMTPEQSKAYNNWIKGGTQVAIETNGKKLEVQQVVIKEGEKIDKGTQAFIKEGEKIDNRIQTANQKLAEINTNLSEIVRETQSINGVPKPDINDLRKQAEKNPPKELQGIPIDIKSEKYDNILLADHYINKAKDITEKINPADKERFLKSISNMSDMMGRQRPVDWPAIVDAQKGGLVLGRSRDQIRDAGNNIIQSGYNKGVTWDPNTRSLIFHGDKGSKSIDTAYVPPRERIIDEPFSVSRDLPKQDPDKIERNILMQKRTGSVNVITSILRNEYKPIESTSIPESIQKNSENIIQQHKKAQEIFAKAPDPESRLEALKGLDRTNEILYNAYRSNLTAENASSTEMKKMEEAIYQEKTGNLALATELERLIGIDKNLKLLSPDTQIRDNFDMIAGENLSWLNSEYFGRMGPGAQEALDRIIEKINQHRDKKNQINLANNILNNSEQNELRQILVNLGGTHDVLTSGDKLPGFQNKITIMLSPNPGKTGKIEDVMLGNREKPEDKK